MQRWLTVALATAMVACAPSLNNEEDAGVRDAAAPDVDGSLPTSSGNFTHAVAGGVVTTVVDASDESAWQHLDLDTGLSTEDGWDLAFSRFRVRTNGGVSGGGGVQVVALEGQDFDALARAPETGWTADRADGEADDDTDPDNVFNNGTSDWYAYDEATHELSPREVTYVVASTEQRFYKLRFETYYDAAGSPAVVRFRWAEIAPPVGALPDAGIHPVDAGMPTPDAGEEPLPAGAIMVDASDAATWVYLDVVDGIVTPSSPETDDGWDLALRRSELRTNSGTSGDGLGGAKASELAFDAITEASTFGFSVDVEMASHPGADPTSLNPILIGWLDYDPVTHSVSPAARSYLVRTGDGGYAKLRVWRWNDGEYALSFAPVERRVDVRELEVDASASGAWTYLSLRDGARVSVSDAAADRAWDLGLSLTRLRTNGGTSGGGSGEAAETSASDIASLSEVPTAGWHVDEMLTTGPPGTPAYSANPALGAWYDYNPATHVVSPRPVVFAVRTADGHVSAVRVLSYADGVYRLAVAFAGPGHSDF